MEEKQIIEDYLRCDLQNEIQSVRLLSISCTMSTIRWIQRYSNCYSIICSFICFPLWILMLPIAFAIDIILYSITLIIFFVVLVVHVICSPYILFYKFSSCSAAWRPINIYRYSLQKSLAWSTTLLIIFQISWSCYCGSGDIESGMPMFCTYCCCKKCRHACGQATGIHINDQSCIIL